MLLTIDECGSKITRKSVLDCQVSNSNGNKKTLLLTIFGLRSLIVLTFSIAYPVWFRCMLHDATVDILFGIACA